MVDLTVQPMAEQKAEVKAGHWAVLMAAMKVVLKAVSLAEKLVALKVAWLVDD